MKSPSRGGRTVGDVASRCVPLLLGVAFHTIHHHIPLLRKDLAALLSSPLRTNLKVPQGSAPGPISLKVKGGYKTLKKTVIPETFFSSSWVLLDPTFQGTVEDQRKKSTLSKEGTTSWSGGSDQLDTTRWQRHLNSTFQIG